MFYNKTIKKSKYLVWKKDKFFPFENASYLKQVLVWKFQQKNLEKFQGAKNQKQVIW